jgi:TolA-binding protein
MFKKTGCVVLVVLIFPFTAGLAQAEDEMAIKALARVEVLSDSVKQLTNQIGILREDIKTNALARVAVLSDTVKQLVHKAEILSDMVNQMQKMMLEMMQSIESNSTMTNELVTIIKDNKGLYAGNQEKLDYVVQSCNEMVKKNGETIYSCKIRLKDELSSLSPEKGK